MCEDVQCSLSHFPRKRESRSNADVLDVHDQLVLVRFWRSGIKYSLVGSTEAIRMARQNCKRLGEDIDRK